MMNEDATDFVYLLVLMLESLVKTRLNTEHRFMDLFYNASGPLQ